jgi:hypothetical protein
MVNLLIYERSRELCSNKEVLLELRHQVGVVHLIIFLYLIYCISFCNVMKHFVQNRGFKSNRGFMKASYNVIRKQTKNWMVFNQIISKRILINISKWITIKMNDKHMGLQGHVLFFLKWLNDVFSNTLATSCGWKIRLCPFGSKKQFPTFFPYKNTLETPYKHQQTRF